MGDERCANIHYTSAKIIINIRACKFRGKKCVKKRENYQN